LKTNEEVPNISKVIDSDTFFSPKVPAEVKKLAIFLHSEEVPLHAFTAIVRKCSEYLVAPPTVDRSVFQALVEATSLKPWTCALLFTGVFFILQRVVRCRVKLEVAERDLLAMAFPAPFVTSLISELRERGGGGHAFRSALLRAEPNPLVSRRAQQPRLKRLRWRVDVTISTSTVSRVMRPTVLMQLILSDGSIKIFEASPEQVHRLRYGIAKVLRSMQELERHPIIRIAAYAEKRSDEVEETA